MVQGAWYRVRGYGTGYTVQRTGIWYKVQGTGRGFRVRGKLHVIDLTYNRKDVAKHV
jgi:hypothetical protein